MQPTYKKRKTKNKKRKTTNKQHSSHRKTLLFDEKFSQYGNTQDDKIDDSFIEHEYFCTIICSHLTVVDDDNIIHSIVETDYHLEI